MEFLRYRRNAETIDGYLAHFDLLRRVAGNRLGSGCSLPDSFTAILCIESAMLIHNHKALVLASNRGRLDLAGISRQMCRLFGSQGEGGRKDALATTLESASTEVEWSKRKPPGTRHDGKTNAEWELGSLLGPARNRKPPLLLLNLERRSSPLDGKVSGMRRIRPRAQAFGVFPPVVLRAAVASTRPRRSKGERWQKGIQACEGADGAKVLRRKARPNRDLLRRQLRFSSGPAPAPGDVGRRRIRALRKTLPLSHCYGTAKVYYRNQDIAWLRHIRL